MVTRDQVKQWFETGDYPTQEQFWQFFDSILFGGEVAVADIAGLIELLQAKLDSAQFDAFYKPDPINVNANYVFAQAANSIVEKIIIIPGADCNIRIGTSNGGEEIMVEVPVMAADPTTQVLVINALALADRNLYINGIPNGSKIWPFVRPLKTV